VWRYSKLVDPTTGKVIYSGGGWGSGSWGGSASGIKTVSDLIAYSIKKSILYKWTRLWEPKYKVQDPQELARLALQVYTYSPTKTNYNALKALLWYTETQMQQFLWFDTNNTKRDWLYN